MKHDIKNFFVKAVFIFCFVTLFPLVMSAADEKNVYITPVENTVEKGMYSFLKRSFSEAEKERADLIILELNTPGGAVDAAADIGKLLRSTKIPTIAFINKDALSAGAYIALNADQIYMVPGATFGAAAIIDQQGNTAGKKAESYWIAAMKSAAELNGRDPIYAIAMADESIDLPEYGAEKGKLLTLTANQALNVHYAEGIVNDRKQLLEKLGYKNAEVTIMEESFAESVARFLTHPIVIPILLSIGSLGLVLELYTPGFGIPGTMGIASLLLFFYGHLVAGLAGLESVILLILGVIFVIAEFFVPGGILGIIGGLAILASLFIATDNIMHLAMSLLIALAVSVTVSIIMIKFFGKKISLFHKIILKDSTNTEKGYVSNKTRTDLIGKTGYSLTMLRPSGTAIIDQERVDVVTEGGFIEANKPIIVVKSEGVRVVVREIEDEKEETNR
jgi:membrane-bound serine protease (ClpP class)